MPQKTNNLKNILAGPCSGTPWYAVKMEIVAHLLADRVPHSFSGVANAMQATGHEDKKCWMIWNYLSAGANVVNVTINGHGNHCITSATAIINYDFFTGVYFYKLLHT